MKLEHQQQRKAQIQTSVINPAELCVQRPWPQGALAYKNTKCCDYNKQMSSQIMSMEAIASLSSLHSVLHRVHKRHRWIQIQAFHSKFGSTDPKMFACNAADRLLDNIVWVINMLCIGLSRDRACQFYQVRHLWTMPHFTVQAQA